VFVDGRTLPDGSVLDADLCLVGAGPAAIAIALTLSGRGMRIVILESGAIRPSIPRKHLDIGHSVGYQYYNLMFTRARAFGGTSSRWHMHAHGDEGWMARPMDPIDFEARPEIPLSGWPFDAAHLAPYYARAHELSDLGPPTFDTADWDRPGMPRLPLPPDVIETVILQRGMTAFTRYHDTFATLPDVTVIHHATAVDVVSSGEPPEVERVVVATGPDARWSVTARRYVLACGGLENPRLMLVSTGQQARGLGNGEDLVGRHFMEHLVARIGHVRPADPGLVDRLGLYDSHPEGSIFVQAAVAPTAATLRAERLPNMAFFLVPRTDAFTAEGVRSLKALSTSVYRRPYVGSTAGHLRNVVRDTREVVTVVGGRVARRPAPATVLAVRVQAEQTPIPESRVTLGRDRDRHGVPRIVLDWRIAPSDLAAIRRGEEVLDEAMGAAGIGRIVHMLGEEHPPVVFEGNHHHMGTTRMDVDPRRGVVDADSRVHGVRNLYVTGTSVFATGGWINPTLTVVALALRLADHLGSDS
jgi:choline dehydrogenase-like flavoprotein